MIRRDESKQWRLFTQDDHAALAGELALHLGGVFAPSSRRKKWELAVRLHDCGWELHDQAPTLNGKGQPRDVFESTAEIACRVWDESVRRASKADPYAGLLVSLHVMSLSAYAISHHQQNASQTAPVDRQALFQLSQFQHNQVEVQESLRGSIGLPVGKPLTYGLDEQSDDPQEQALVCDLKLLQLMDQLSLAVLCTKVPFASMAGVPMRPGGAAVSVQIKRLEDEHSITATPWPFDRAELVIPIPCRVLPNRPLENDAALGSAWQSTRPEPWSCRLVRS